MSRISKLWFVLTSVFLMTSLVCYTANDVGAQDKTDKKTTTTKDEKKDKKDDKKEEKKEPFKPDQAAIEFKGPSSKDTKTDWIYGLAFTDDGKTLAALSRNRLVQFWDLDGKKEIRTLKAAGRDTQGIALVKGQLYVGTGEFNKKKNVFEGEIKVWDVKNPDAKVSKSLKGHSDFIVDLAVTNDGKSLASASKDQTVLIWDLAEGKVSQTIKGHTDAVNSVSFSPDGKQVVTTSADKTVRVWDVAGAKEIANFKVEKVVETKDPKKGKVTQTKELGREFTRAIFSHDGKRIIAGNLDGLIKIYDVEGKKEVQELKAHEGIWALALSPDGSKFATGGYDQTIKIWDADGKELRTIKAHIGTVTALRFSPDNAWLASGGLDGMVKIWSVSK